MNFSGHEHLLLFIMFANHDDDIFRTDYKSLPADPALTRQSRDASLVAAAHGPVFAGPIQGRYEKIKMLNALFYFQYFSRAKSKIDNPPKITMTARAIKK